MASRVATRGVGGSLGAGLSTPDRYLGAIILTTLVILPLAFLPVMEDSFALPKVTVLRMALGLTLVCLAAISVSDGKKVLPAPLGALALCYLCLNVLAFFVSSDPSRSLLGEYLQYQGVITILAYIVFFYASARVFQPAQRVQLLLWAAVAGGVPVAAYALGQTLDLDPIGWSFGSGPPERAFSSIGQANALAAYLVLVIPLAVGLLRGATPLRKYLLLAVIAMSVAALAVTFSRAGYLALFVALSIALLPAARHSVSRGALFKILGLTAVFTIFVLSVQPLRATAGEVVDRAVSAGDLHDTSMQKRLGMWEVAGQIIIDRPLLGTGHETYPEMFSQYRDSELPGFGLSPARPESPHNNYLAIASSTGVASLAVYLAIIGSVFYLVLFRRGTGVTGNPTGTALSYAVCGALAGHLITDAFMTAETASSWLFWLLMGAAAGGAAAEENRSLADASSRANSSPSWRVALRPAVVSVGVAIAVLSIFPVLAEGEASQANRSANEGNFYAAASQYGRAARLNPFESRYSERRADALFRGVADEYPERGVALRPP